MKTVISGNILKSKDFQTRRDYETWQYRASIPARELAIKEALEGWLLNMDWSEGVRADFTFLVTDKFDPNSKDYCRRLFKNEVLDHVAFLLHGKRHRRRGLGPYGFLAWEKMPSSQLHVHTLMNGVKGLRRLDLVDYTWAHERLGSSRVQPVTEERIRYAVEYVTKSPDSWELFGPDRMWRRAMPPLVMRLDQVVRESEKKRPLRDAKEATGGAEVRV